MALISNLYPNMEYKKKKPHYSEDKAFLISELHDSLAAVENEIAILQIRVADAEDRHAEDHEQIQKILARLGL
ncbi:hypothetical protein Tco_0519222 [Tanacetum coccineum]